MYWRQPNRLLRPSRPPCASAPWPSRASPVPNAGQRPLLPQVQTYDTARFRIHFTLRGGHAVPPADRDNDGVPDYVSFVGSVAEEVWQGLVDEMVWPPPVVDAGAGGVMIARTSTSKTWGQSSWATATATPDPVAITGDAWRGRPPAPPSLSSTTTSIVPARTPDLIRITVAHEFLHVLQFGIDSSEPGDWMWEAWAVWGKRCFSTINAYYLMLPPLFTAPDAPLNRHPYTAVLLPLWLDEHVDPLAPRDVWLHAAEADGLDALSLALEQHGVVPHRRPPQLCGCAPCQATLPGVSALLLGRGSRLSYPHPRGRTPAR